MLALKIIVVPVSGDDHDMRPEGIYRHSQLLRCCVDQKFDGYVGRDRLQKHAAFLVEAEGAIGAQAHVHYVDDGIVPSARRGGCFHFALQMTAARTDEKVIVDSQKFPGELHETIRGL